MLVVHVETQRHYRVAASDIASPGGHRGGSRDPPRPFLHRPRRAYRWHLAHLHVESTADAAAGSSPTAPIAATMITIAAAAFVIDVVVLCGTARPDDYFARLSYGLVDYLITFGA